LGESDRSTFTGESLRRQASQHEDDQFPFDHFQNVVMRRDGDTIVPF